MVQWFAQFRNDFISQQIECNHGTLGNGHANPNPTYRYFERFSTDHENYIITAIGRSNAASYITNRFQKSTT